MRKTLLNTFAALAALAVFTALPMTAVAQEGTGEEAAVVEEGTGEFGFNEDGTPSVPGEPQTSEEAFATGEQIVENVNQGKWAASLAGACFLIMFLYRRARKKYEWDVDKSFTFILLLVLGFVGTVLAKVGGDMNWIQAITTGLAAVGGPQVAQALDHGLLTKLLDR